MEHRSRTQAQVVRVVPGLPLGLTVAREKKVLMGLALLSTAFKSLPFHAAIVCRVLG